MNVKEQVLKIMFGKNNEFAGYESICSKLITEGSCISTIHASDLFRRGGIHNFVKQEPFEEGIDLIKISIDKEKIYTVGFFKEYAEAVLCDKVAELRELKARIEKLNSEIEELSQGEYING